MAILEVLRRQIARSLSAPGAHDGWGAEDDREEPAADPVRPSPWTRKSQPAEGPWSRETHGDHLTGSPTARDHAPPTHATLERLRGRLKTPDGLREAFVLKEILDRPLARRR